MLLWFFGHSIEKGLSNGKAMGPEGLDSHTRALPKTTQMLSTHPVHLLPDAFWAQEGLKGGRAEAVAEGAEDAAEPGGR